MIFGVLTGPGPGSELDLLRTRPQRTLLSLAIPTYNVIYRAFVITTLTDNDNVISVAFDGGGGGTLANVLPGMTLLVGNGLSQWDAGIVRIRDYIDSGGGVGYFLIGITSDIEWIDGLFLTVVDEYGLWPKHPFINPITHVSYMDYDIAYNLGAPGLNVKQNEYGAPVPILGSHVVLELTGATVTTTFDANQSYSCINAPASYTFAWSCPDPTVIFSAPAAGNTDATFTSAGTYIIYLSVTANYAGGYSAESIAVRYVIVHDAAHPLNTSFSIESKPTGNYDEGGWSYRVTMNANATELIIRDRTLCILVAKDWYGATEQSIGPLVGRENIVCIGWIDGESLRRSNDKSTVSFDVQGPAWWLGVQEGFPTGVDDTNVAPVDWSHIQALDPRKGLFAFLHWRTTATTIMDCYITDDDHRLATTYTPAGSLLEQLEAIGERINANKVLCDRYGRLFCEIDTQFIVPGSRTFPIVQTLTDRDWRDEITIERREVAEAGQVDLSGVHFSGVIPLDATTYSIFSLSPGHYPKHYGSKYKVEKIALDDQAEADLIAGLWLGYLNNEYPNIDTPMSSNYRAVDIAPRMFVRMNMAFGDTPRGIVFVDKQLIPREVSFGYDEREAVLLTDITFEAETFPGLAITGDPPIEPPTKKPPVNPPLLCNDPLALNFGGPLPCIYAPLTDVVVMHNNKHVLRCLNFFDLINAAIWEEINVAGKVAGDTICSLSIDPDGGAWLVTVGADLTTTGVFRTADIIAGSFALVYSQSQANADSIATKTLLSIPNPTAMPIRSIISMGNGAACTHETGSLGADQAPNAAFASSDGGGSWTVSVPWYNTSGWWWNRAFWASSYFDSPCHQIDWDGAQVVITGDKKDVHGAPNEYSGAYVTSPDGINWTLVPAIPTTYPDFFSCNIIGGSVYGYNRGAACMVLLPDTPVSPALSFSFGFRRTQFGGALVEIRHLTALNTNTGLYIGGALQRISGGGVATVSVVNGGTGGTYAPGDILTLTAPDGGTSATVTVITTAGDDVVTVSLTTAGAGYAIGTYATAGGGGTGCTIGVLTLSGGVPPFGIARVIAADEFILAARDSGATEVVDYQAASVVYDRTGNLLAEIGMAWEGMMAGSNSWDYSGIEYVAI